MLWVATPVEYRDHRKLGDYAEAVKIDRTTLWRWSLIPGFHDEVQKLTKQFIGDAVPEVLQALKQLARQGNFNHMKLYLEMAGMYTPKQEVTGKDGEPLATVQIIEVVR